MELKRLRISITIVDQLLTNLGMTIFMLKIQRLEHLQVVKIMMRASRMFGVAAILVLQPVNGAMVMQRTCTGAVLSHARQAHLPKKSVTHCHIMELVIMPTIRKYALVREEEFSMSEDCYLVTNEVPTNDVP